MQRRIERQAQQRVGFQAHGRFLTLERLPDQRCHIDQGGIPVGPVALTLQLEPFQQRQPAPGVRLAKTVGRNTVRPAVGGEFLIQRRARIVALQRLQQGVGLVEPAQRRQNPGGKAQRPKAQHRNCRQRFDFRQCGGVITQPVAQPGSFQTQFGMIRGQGQGLIQHRQRLGTLVELPQRRRGGL